jgi:hypothetical protein
MEEEEVGGVLCLAHAWSVSAFVMASGIICVWFLISAVPITFILLLACLYASLAFAMIPL